MLFFFLFKQKTAYEMRISDWSSDVCSSDLPSPKTNRGAAPPRPTTLTLFDCLVTGAGVEGLSGTMAERSREGAERMTSAAKQSEIPEAGWAVGLMSGTSMDGIDAALIRERTSVGTGRRGSVHEGPEGRRRHKTKRHECTDTQTRNTHLSI